jgi:hypothetical protein
VVGLVAAAPQRAGEQRHEVIQPQRVLDLVHKL